MIDRLPSVARRLQHRRLANGLRVNLLPERSNPLTAVNLWYHVGSKNDTPGRSGLAHLFEHMLFQGSLNVDTNGHFQWIQQAGGVANGSTDFDRTNYYQTVPTGALELALWLESDRMGYLLPALNEEKFEAQRSVVINERLQRIDNRPYGRAFETLFGDIFPSEHPYSWPIIGVMDHLHKAELADVRGFFRTHYRPNNAVLTLAGDFEPEAAFELASKHFGAIEPGDPEAPMRRAGVPTAKRVKTVLEDRVILPRVYLAWPIPGLADPTCTTAEMLATTLALGKSSPLHRDLILDRQIAQDVAAGVASMELCSVFLIVATGRADSDPAEIEEVLVEHLAAVAERTVDETACERARNQTMMAIYSQLESVERTADLISHYAVFFDDPRAIDANLAQYTAVESQQMTEFARRHLPIDRRTTLHVVPTQGVPS